LAFSVDEEFEKRIFKYLERKKKKKLPSLRKDRPGNFYSYSGSYRGIGIRVHIQNLDGSDYKYSVFCDRCSIGSCYTLQECKKVAVQFIEKHAKY
jgi:hypothetical protein